MNEKMSVVIIDTTEKLSKRKAVKANVAQKAKTEIKHPFLKDVQSFSMKLILVFGFSAISE